MSSTYAAVDDVRDPDEAMRWQERIDAWPMIAAYKRRSFELLPDQGPILDVGCGPGGDIASLGRRAVGVDRSAVMCRRARDVGGVVCRGDAGALPFRAGAFVGCTADRVLQHVPEPLVALGEMIRVVRPGGVVVVAEPDQETLVIQVPGVPRELTDRVKGARRDVGYRNGRLAAALPQVLREMGMGAITIDAYPLVLVDPADAFGLAGWPRQWMESRDASFNLDEVELWERAIDAAQVGGIVYAVVYFVVSGTRP